MVHGLEGRHMSGSVPALQHFEELFGLSQISHCLLALSRGPQVALRCFVAAGERWLHHDRPLDIR